MRNAIKGTLVALLVAVCACFTACADKKAQAIDNLVYFDDEVYRLTYGVTKSTSMSLKDNVLGEEANSWQYTQLVINGKQKWICSMTISTIEFTFETTHDATLDLTLTLTNVLKTDNFNKEKDYYYHTQKATHVTKAGKQTTIVFNIDDTINASKAPVLTLNIDELCYKNNTELFVKITDFNVYGEHII